MDKNLDYNQMPLVRLRSITTDNEGQRGKFLCKVISIGDLETYTKSCEVNCWMCHDSAIIEADEEHKLPRLHCQKCDIPIKINREKIETEFIRTVIIQEPLSECIDMNPIRYEAEVYGDFAKKIQMGTDYKLVGYFRSRKKQRDTRNKIVFEIEAFSEENSITELLPDKSDIEKYLTIDKCKLIADFAPEILGFDIVKEGALLSCIGGSQTDDMRGDINALFMGDPSVGKTRILMFVNKIMQRSAYTQGRSSSSAGLILGIDVLSDGTRILSAGPVVLCNGGVVCIDEIDKMSTSDKVSLHEVMEKQTATINKMGGKGTLSAKTTIIAAANPIGSKWDDGLSIMENIHFPETLLSRFGIKLKVLDVPDRENDEAIARHQIKTRMGKLEVNMTIEDYTKFINYIRKINPVISKEAENKIVEYYVNLRSYEQTSGSIPIDRRTNEDLIRLSTAYTRMRMSEVVSPQDVDNAILFMKKCLDTFGMNTSGEMKDKLMVTEKMNKEQFIEHCIRKCVDDKGEINDEYLSDVMNDGKHFKTRGTAKNAVNRLMVGGKLLKCISGNYRYNP